MDAKQWQRMWSIFEEAVECPPDQRAAFLQSACGDDRLLRETIEQLIEADEESASLENQTRKAGKESQSVEPIAQTAGLQAVGPYKLLREIGQGGMGKVYLAVRQDDFQRQVAVKIIQQGLENADIIERFKAERQILASLDHPYIARLYDGGTTEDQRPYFVMEHVEGIPIDAYCDQESLSLEERLQLFLRVCSSVQYAHANLVVHRDLKPANILVDGEGNPHLLDFGIAKLLNPDQTSMELGETVPWRRALTPSYASPEQVRGERITTASDVYSLGVVLYKLLTGHLPHDFTGCSQPEIERILSQSEPLKPSKIALQRSTRGDPGGEGPEQPDRAQRKELRELSQQLSGDLDAVLLKALRLAPAERYASVEQLTVDLERYRARLPVTAHSDAWLYRAGKFVRRHAAAVTVSTLILTLLLAFAAAMAWQSARIADERDQARRERDAKQSVIALMLDIFQAADPIDGNAGQSLTVEEAIDRSGGLIERRLKDKPLVRAEILHAIGTIYTNLGNFDQARQHLEQALELRRSILGPRHLAVAETLTALSNAVREQGHDEQARSLAQQALDMTVELVGDNHVATLDPMQSLITVLHSMRDFEASEPLTIRARQLAASLPPQDPLRVTTLISRAFVTKGMGDLETAADLYRQAAEQGRAIFGEQDYETAIAINNWGVTLRQLERFDEAEPVLREALTILQGLLGDEHPYLIPLYNNMGGVMEAQHKYAEAKEYFSKGLSTLQASLGPEHPRNFFLYYRIQSVRLWMGEEGAEQDLRRALEKARITLGADHRWVGRAEGVLGAELVRQKRFSEAEPLLISCYRTLAEKGTPGQKKSASEWVIKLYEQWGKPEKADEYRRQQSTQ